MLRWQYGSKKLRKFKKKELFFLLERNENGKRIN